MNGDKKDGGKFISVREGKGKCITMIKEWEQVMSEEWNSINALRDSNNNSNIKARASETSVSCLV